MPAPGLPSIVQIVPPFGAAFLIYSPILVPINVLLDRLANYRRNA